MAIDTSGLSGYAKAYAEARNSGASDTSAHATATASHGTGGSGHGSSFAAFSSDSPDPIGYALDNSSQGYSATGIVPKYGEYGKDGIIPTVQTPTVTQTPIIPVANQDLMKTLLQTLPTYTYQPQAYQQTTPSYSITKNPNDTTFIPTVKSKQLWNETQNQNADNAYKTYSTQMANYTQAYQQIQDQIANALKQQTLDNQTIAQKAQAALDAANAKKADEATAWAQNPNNPDNIAKLAQADYYNSRGSSSGSSGSSGGLTPYQQYQIEQAGNKSEAESEATFNKRVDDLASKSFAEDSSYTLNQWRDAWRIQLLSEMGQ